MLHAQSIARRMLVTNSFDSLLSTLGIILGAYLSGAQNVAVYVGSAIGASLALGIFSGFVATYMSERAERLRELKETEKAMLKELKGSIYDRAARVVPVYVASWSATGSLLPPVVGVSPFLAALVLDFRVEIKTLVYLSVTVIIIELFLLGVYLGKISGENKIVSGLRMASIGIAAAMLFAIIDLLI